MNPFTPAQREKVIKSIKERSAFSRHFIIMNTLAAVIASYGLFINSPAVIIGAMVVALLMDPLMGVALGLMISQPKLVRGSLKTFIAGIAVIFIVSVVLGYIHTDIPIGSEITTRTSPNILDLMIALAGGAAAAYAIVAPKLISSLVGVAIATALLPPLAASGILLAHGDYKLAGDALLLVLVNIIAMQFSMSIVLWLTGFRKVTRSEGATIKTFALRNIISIGILIILAFILTFNFRNAVEKEVYRSTARQILNEEVEKTEGDTVAEVIFETSEDQPIVSAQVNGPRNEISPQEVAAIESKLPPSPEGKNPNLRIRYIHVFATDKNGQIYIEEPTVSPINQPSTNDK